MKKQLSILTVLISLFFGSIFTNTCAQAKKGNSKPDVTVSRSVSNTDNTVAIVTITVTKQGYKGHAEIEEDFSSDLQATVVSGSHASFHSSNGKAIFDWDNISEDRTVTVSYSLRAIRKTSEDQTVSGHLSYQNQTFNMPPSSFKIEYNGNSPAPMAQQAFDASSTNTLQDLYYIIFGDYPESASTSGATYIAPAKATAPANNIQPVQKHEVAPPAPVQQKPVVAETPKPAPPPMAATATVNSGNATPVAPAPTPAIKAAPPAPVSAPSGNLVYRIQIAAVGDKSKAGEVLKQYNISDEPYLEAASPTITRVLIGSYPNLSSAKARIDALKSKGLTGAYAVPYYKGKRISMQEAATHTQQ